jgi:hypothetical protein
MDSSIRIVQIIRMALLGSVVIYVALGEGMGNNLHLAPSREMFYALAGMAVVMAVSVVMLRRALILQAQPALASNPADLNALNRWRTGYIVVYAMSEAIALFGLVLRLTGFTLSLVAPFYIAGALLILFFPPRRPSNEIG